MRLQNLLGSRQIGNGPRHLKNPAESPCRQPKLVGDHLQQGFTFRIQLTRFANVPRLHLVVGMQAKSGQPLTLPLPGRFNPGTDRNGWLGIDRVGQVTMRNARDLDMQVDAIEQGPGQPRPVALQHRQGTAAVMLWITEEATGTGV